MLGGFVSSGVADLLEGPFDELFALLADVVIDGAHRLDRAGCRTGEGEFAIDHFALVERKSTVAEDHEAAVRELAAFIFVEIEDDFFIGEIVLGDFHLSLWVMVFDSWEPAVKGLDPRSATPIKSQCPAVQLEHLAGSVRKILMKMLDEFRDRVRGVETP